MKTKKQLCQDFADQLKKWKINHEVFNDGIHIQIQRIHNFYPTKSSYYNTDTGEKTFYPKFKSNNELMLWLGERLSPMKLTENGFTLEYILETLEQCETLLEAKKHFQSKAIKQ